MDKSKKEEIIFGLCNKKKVMSKQNLSKCSITYYPDILRGISNSLTLEGAGAETAPTNY